MRGCVDCVVYINNLLTWWHSLPSPAIRWWQGAPVWPPGQWILLPDSLPGQEGQAGEGPVPPPGLQAPRPGLGPTQPRQAEAEVGPQSHQLQLHQDIQQRDGRQHGEQRQRLRHHLLQQRGQQQPDAYRWDNISDIKIYSPHCATILTNSQHISFFIRDPRGTNNL